MTKTFNLSSFLKLIVIPIVLLNFTACGGNGSSSDQSITLTATFSGLEVIPAVLSQETGTASFNLNTNTGSLSGSATISDSSDITAAHIHLGEVGSTGGIAVTLEQDATNPNQYNVPANTVLSGGDIVSFENEEAYVQFHSNTFTVGTARGQLLLEDTDFIRITVSLSSQESIPVVNDSTGTGSSVLLLNTSSGQLGGGLHVSGLQGDTLAGHIHLGSVGETGAIAVTLDKDPNNSESYNVPPETALDTTNLTAMLSEGTYFNIHVVGHETGEVRGQILTQSGNAILTASLNGDSVVPPIETTGSGAAFLLVNQTTGSLSGRVLTSDLLANITATHIHLGDAGQEGGIAVTLEADANDASIYNIPASIVLTPDDLDAVLNEGTYVQVHTDTDATRTGEIRGQVILTNNLNQSTENPPPPSATLEPTLASIQVNVFETSCGVSGCHVQGTAAFDLRLDTLAMSRANLINVASGQSPSILRVEPFDPDNSYLIQKLEGTGLAGRMPLGRNPLDPTVIGVVRQWIADGANP